MHPTEQLFHQLWGQAKESPEYDKKKWCEMHLILTDLLNRTA